MEDRTILTKTDAISGLGLRIGGRDRNRLAAFLEKQGLHQVAHILEKYGIGSETEVSELDQDYFSNLALKPLDTKKLKRWCERVRARVKKMLPSSSEEEIALWLHAGTLLVSGIFQGKNHYCSQ